MSETNNFDDDSDVFADDNQPLIEGTELEFRDGKFPKSRHVFALIGKFRFLNFHSKII